VGRTGVAIACDVLLTWLDNNIVIIKQNLLFSCKNQITTIVPLGGGCSQIDYPLEAAADANGSNCGPIPPYICCTTLLPGPVSLDMSRHV
jgi:hypothetical protein